MLARDRKLLSGLFRSIADPSADVSIFGERTRAVRDDSILLFDRAISPSPEIAALDPAARRVLVLALWSLHMGVMLYFIHDASPKQHKTRALVDRTLDLVVGLLPLAPQLAPMFGAAIGSILAEAGLLGGPEPIAARRILAPAPTKGRGKAMSDSIESHQKEVRRFPPSAEFSAKALVQSHAEYTSMYELSLDEPETFWRENTQDLVFRTPWKTFSRVEAPAREVLRRRDAQRHRELPRSPPHDERAHTRRDRLGGRARRRRARSRTSSSIARSCASPPRSPTSASTPGDRVAIYMGMVPETAVAMLACARIGATHSVIFGGFAADALRERINDCGAKVLLTQDGAWRRGNVVPLKKMADDALAKTHDASSTSSCSAHRPRARARRR